MKALLSSEFLERYREGERNFSDIVIQFADFRKAELRDVTFRNSKLFFVTFYDCIFTSARFMNCDIFYGSWNGGLLENTVFDRCRIDYTIFHNGTLKNVKAAKSYIRWCLFFSKPFEEFDYLSSVHFKVFRDPSHVTDNDIEEALNELAPFFGSLDISIRARIKKELHEGAEKYGRKLGNIPEGKSLYEKNLLKYETKPSAYGTSAQNVSSSLINAYNALQSHRTKTPYETDRKYK